MKKMIGMVQIFLACFLSVDAMSNNTCEDEDQALLPPEHDDPDGESVILIDNTTGVIPTAVAYKIIDAPQGFNKWAYVPASCPEEQKMLERYRCKKLVLLYDKDCQLLALGALSLLPVDLHDSAGIDQYIREHLLDPKAPHDKSACLLM